MADYEPNPTGWVAKQVELYESTNGREGSLLRGLPCVIVTYTGRKSGAVRKTALMRVKDVEGYVLVASLGGSPKHPLWYFNLRDEPNITIRDVDQVMEMRATEITDPAERARLWALSVEAFPPYAEYQLKTSRVIPVFRAAPR